MSDLKRRLGMVVPTPIRTAYSPPRDDLHTARMRRERTPDFDRMMREAGLQGQGELHLFRAVDKQKVDLRGRWQDEPSSRSDSA